MRFSFVEKFEEKKEEKFRFGDIVEFIKGSTIGEVCLVGDGIIVSIQHPNMVWENILEIREKLRKVPPGSTITLTQE